MDGIQTLVPRSRRCIAIDDDNMELYYFEEQLALYSGNVSSIFCSLTQSAEAVEYTDCTSAEG